MELPLWESILNADLACKSLKDVALAKRWRGVAAKTGGIDMSMCIPEKTQKALYHVWRQIVAPINDINASGGQEDVVFPAALYFATRPLDVTDLYTIGNCVDSLVGLEDIKEILRVFNCRIPVAELPHLQAQEDSEHLDTIIVRHNFYPKNVDVQHVHRLKLRIALVSWKVEDDSWVAMACGMPDPFGCDRFKRLMHIVNRILAMESEACPHYLIFPELAMPPDIFARIAKKLSYKGVSLIAGVDYLQCGVGHDGKRLVDNQVWCALCSSVGRGMPVIYRYNKSEPAIHEAAELGAVARAKYRCDGRASVNQFVISHGDSRLNVSFSVLICSDLRDIRRRATLRGHIDLLVVPAWNPDVKTYSALVDAAAHDIHTYVALCNSRTYGDTRLRSPAKIEHLRDVVRLKGGRDDFFVIGEIDINKLRRFQSGYNLNHASFKPCPIGFKISEDRRTLPLSSSENA